MDDRLLSLLYQYGVGGLLFWYGLRLCRRSDATENRRWVLPLWIGFLAYLAFHAYFQLVAPRL